MGALRRGIVGVDEAGRGPLAGPVAVGVVRISHISPVKRLFPQVKDSKQLPEKRREEWFKKIQKLKKEGHLTYGVALVSASHIDTRGIVDAIRKGMKKALLMASARSTDAVKLDGGLRAPEVFKNQKAYTKGDATYLEIALASVCAKVLRDMRMCTYAKLYPKYGFEVHKGYGTALHITAIKKYGLSKLHRKTFCKPNKNKRIDK